MRIGEWSGRLFDRTDSKGVIFFRDIARAVVFGVVQSIAYERWGGFGSTPGRYSRG